MGQKGGGRQVTREEAIHIIEKDIQIDVRSCTNEEVHAFITALNMAISALREQEDPKAVLVQQYIKVPEKPKWISVEERLPEDKCECLVYVKPHSAKAYVKVSWFYPCYDGSDPDMKGRKLWTGYDSDWGMYELRNVTHWMPLPEAPKEDV
jgi:hypothetical protein